LEKGDFRKTLLSLSFGIQLIHQLLTEISPATRSPIGLRNQTMTLKRKRKKETKRQRLQMNGGGELPRGCSRAETREM